MKFLVFLHLLGASVWVGGHLLLLFRYLPEALKKHNPEIIRNFENKYEAIGIPSLFLQVVTGILLGMNYEVRWFSFDTHFNTVFNLKVLFLGITILLAIHARFFIIPKLSSHTLKSLGWHIALVSIVSVIFVFLGLTFRYGW